MYIYITQRGDGFAFFNFIDEKEAHVESLLQVISALQLDQGNYGTTPDVSEEIEPPADMIFSGYMSIDVARLVYF